jgi:membrane protease subunit HflK
MHPRAAAASDVRAAWRGIRRFGGVIPAVAVALYLLSGFYVIKPGDIGVVRRFGRVRSPSVLPGIHYRIPWPVDRVDHVSVHAIRRMSIGFKIRDAEAGIPPLSSETQFLTGDANILDVRVVLQYVIRDPVKSLFSVEAPEWLVRKAGEAALASLLAGMPVDEVLTTGKLRLQDRVKARVQEMLDGYGSGFAIVGATLQDATPPSAVAPAFRSVASAREDRQREINEAHGMKNEVIPRARGRAERTVTVAGAEKAARSQRAAGDADRFLALAAEYEKAPRVTADRIYRERMEEILAGVNLYILGEREGAPSPVRLRIMKKPPAPPARSYAPGD